MSNWRRCAVCAHFAQAAIEKKIREGASLELLAERYGIGNEVLRTHRDSHMQTQVPSTAVRSAVVMSSRMDAEWMFREHEDVKRECHELIDYARSKQNIGGWVRGVQALLNVLDQENRILGLYNAVAPDAGHQFSKRITEVIARALESFPEAKEKVLAAIDEIEQNDVG